jgi:hypothetical protein
MTAPRYGAPGPLRLARRTGRAALLIRNVHPRDWPAVALTVVTALAVEVGLRTLRLPVLARMAGAPLADNEPDGPHVAELAPGTLSPRLRRRLWLCVEVMRHWPFDEKCLRRSLVCGWRIRHLGPRLMIGVAMVDGEVQAHAWLTVNGQSLDPWGSAAFAPLHPLRPPIDPAP